MFSLIAIPPLVRTVLIITITIVTLLGIMIRPWKITEALFALGGALLLLLLGLINPATAFSTLLADWNTFGFFLGMMSLSALAEVAGLFDWLAGQAARLAGNSSARLFLNTFIL